MMIWHEIGAAVLGLLVGGVAGIWYGSWHMKRKMGPPVETKK